MAKVKVTPDFAVFKTTDNPPIYTSKPDKIQRHDISDEELEMLCDNKKDYVTEILLAAAGGTIGSAASAIAALVSYFRENSEGNIEVIDLTQIVIFFVGLFVTLFVGVIAFSRYKRAKSLQQRIRDRTSKEQ